MQNRHDHNSSRLRPSDASMIIAVGCLLAVFFDAVATIMRRRQAHVATTAQ